MAKRRMRRTSQDDERQTTAEALSDTAADMSVSVVRAATEAAKAALEGMQQLGRTMADMAAPAARRTVRTANDVTRATLDSTSRTVRSPRRAATGRGRRGGKRRAA